MAADDAVKLFFVHVGQGDKVAHHQGKTPVVILHVQGLAQARRHLGDKAERAVVVTGARAQRHAFPEMKPHGLHLVFPNGKPHRLAVPFQLDLQLTVGDQRLIVDLVNNILAVDAQKHIAGENSGPMGRRTAIHRGNFMAHAVPPSGIQTESGSAGRAVVIMPRFPGEVKEEPAGLRALLPFVRCCLNKTGRHIRRPLRRPAWRRSLPPSFPTERQSAPSAPA